MKKSFLLFALAAMSTTMFAQSATTDGVIKDKSPAVTMFADDGTVVSMTAEDAKQRRSVSSGCYYAKPTGMMYIPFVDTDFTRNTNNTMCYAPFFDNVKWLNMSNHPLKTYWNIKTEAGTEGTNVESDVEGNYVQVLTPGELSTVPYLYDTADGSYYNFAYREYNSTSTAGQYLQYSIGYGYNDSLGFFTWTDNKNFLTTGTATFREGYYDMGPAIYTTTFTVTDKEGNRRVIDATFPLKGIGENLYAPASPLYVEYMGFYGCTIGFEESDMYDTTFQPIRNGAVLTMSIYDQATGELMETLTATTGDWTVLNLIDSSISMGGHRRGFMKFTKKVDGEAVPFVIDRAITVEITGFEDADNVSCSLFENYANTDALLDEGLGKAYWIMTDPTGEYEVDNLSADDVICSRPWASICGYGIMDKVYATTSYNYLAISADGAICSNENVSEENNIGGAHVRTALPWVNAETGEANYTTSEALPSWITSINYEAYGDKKNEYIISFTAEPNVSADSRIAVVYLQGKGFTDPTPITITQMGGYNPIFVETNDDKIDIYYNIIDAGDLSCEVMYSLDENYSGNIVVPEKVTHNGQTYKVVAIGNYAFGGCTGLTSITLPNSITEIKSNAFYNCTGLTSFTMPENITSIGYRAFRSCTGLTSIDIPLSVTSWGEEVFSTCSNLATATLYEGMTYIPLGMFYNCRVLDGVTIPSTVTEIGEWAFQTCQGLKSITIPKGVKIMGDGAFSGASGLTSITFEEGSEVTSLPYYVFYYCYNLAELNNIPKNITHIGNCAFGWTVYSNDMALDFSECQDLTLIDDYAFASCQTLTDIKLPASVNRIGGLALSNCKKLEGLTIYNPEPPSCGTEAFTNTTGTCTLYVPAGSKEAYSTADQWKDFFNIVEMEGTGINSINPDENEIVGYYTVGGQKVNAPQKGVNIVRYTDGTTKKVLVK